MRNAHFFFLVVTLLISFATTGYAALSEEQAAELGEILSQAPLSNHWQVKADDVYAWMQAKRTDFMIIDVRPNPPGQKGGKIPGAIYIPYNEILKAENLKKLPKGKKLVLVCVTGQTQNLPVLVLRALGYDAGTMSFGHAAWITEYLGSNFMKQAIQNAAEKNFPVEP